MGSSSGGLGSRTSSWGCCRLAEEKGRTQEGDRSWAGLGTDRTGRRGRSRGVLLTLERPWKVLQPLEASGLRPVDPGFTHHWPIQDCLLCTHVCSAQLESPGEEEA